MKTAMFFNAIKNGDIHTVKKTLEAGMSPDVKNEVGQSAVEMACFYEHADVIELLLNPPPVKKLDLPAEIESDQDNPICIVGYSSIFPGSGYSPDDFWKTLSGDHHKMTEIPAERWPVDVHYSPDKKEPSKMYTRHSGFIDQSPYGFDADFFKIVPREAELMDPQQRLVLEATWLALENAGINPHELRNQPVSVFCGIMTHDYADMLIQSGVEHSSFIGTGNGASVLSGRVSYFFGLQGPCMTVDTACSSSLVTAHLAMRSLQNGECDVALAGGVNVMLAPGVTINCCKANMLAEDGVCKSFSEDADGYGRGEGVGMLVLKRYKDAIRDNNTIHGIIRGSAVNQDGASSGLTVPNKQAQVQVIRKALESAGLLPDDIDFVEAHGTGTLLGDPIEINALKEVFSERNPNILPVLINSLKSFVGHLEAAAGVAGIIRVLESFKNNMLTALPIHGKLNPKIQLENTRLSILQEKINWKTADNRARRAGISSFGFSGTNAHMILEEPPAQELSLKQKLEAQWTDERVLAIPEKASIDSTIQLLTISAKDERALAKIVKQYISWLENLSAEKANTWIDVTYSNQTGRAHFPCRFIIQADSLKDCLRQLRQWSPASSTNKLPKAEIQLVIPDLAEVDLISLQQRYQEDALFSALCQELIKEQSDDMSFALDYLAGKSNLDPTWQLDTTKLIVIYALYRRYQRMGIQPSQIISQGSGRFLAAVIDGRLSHEDMLKLFKAYSLKDDILFGRVKNTIITYASDSYWKVQSEQICEDLYQGNLLDQHASSPLTISLHSGSQASILNNVSAIYLAGYDLNWRSMWQGSLRQFIQLPLYPFQRTRHQFKAVHTSVKVDQHTATVNEMPAAAYCTTWEPFLLAEQEQLPVTKTPILLILTDRQSHDKTFVQTVIQSLNQTGQTFLWCSEGTKGQMEGGYTIAFDQAEDWKWLNQQLSNKKISRMIDFRYMDIQTEQQTLAQQSLSDYLSKRLYQSQLFFQAWPGKDIERGYVAFFPKGQAVEEQIQLCHSGLQSQLRSVGLQYGQIVSALIEYHPTSYMQTLTDLVCYQIEGVAVKYEQGQWFTQILSPILTHHEPSFRILSYNNKDSVVITGGLGALGLTMAMWYAEKGIGHIALIARRQPTEEQTVQIKAISNQVGVSIQVYQADVTDASQLTTVIQHISQSFTIRDVYHLAGKATIKRIDKLTEQDYQDSLTAKVLGAVNLRQALMTLPYWPKQVLLFSSVASLLPEPGQATYAASNCMLDGLANLSQNTDKPIRVINWGLWGAAGAGADPEFVKRIRKGSGVLSEKETQTWLEKVLATTYHQVAVLIIDWSVYQKNLTKAEKVFVKQLILSANSVTVLPAQSSNRREYLMKLNESERRSQVMQMVKQAVVDVSGKSSDLLQPITTFEEALGLDSNLLTEIKDILQEKIGCNDFPYAATLLNDHESIEALTAYLLTDLTQKKYISQDSVTPTDYIRQLIDQRDVQIKIKLLKKVSEPQEPPLVLIHTIMGSVFFYKALVENLYYSGHVYGIDNPYFSNLAKKFNSIKEMAKAYAQKIKEQFGDHPVRLAGLSFAGAVAYEVAQQLSDFDVKVDSVLMFDTAMPGVGDLTLPPTQRQYVMGDIAEDINEYYQAEIDNNQRILNAYRPGVPKNNLRVILLKARSRDSVNRALPSLNEICNGWLNLFCPEVYSVPGSHFSMFDRTYVNTTVKVMRYAYNQLNYFVDKELQPVVTLNREKLLIQAAKNGDSYLVVRLLKTGVDPLTMDEEKNYAACFSAQHDDLCSLAWIHYYAQGQLPIAKLFPWAIQGNALKTMSYLVENSEIKTPSEPDSMLLMDSNKQQAVILHDISQPYQQREWMQILAAHNDSAKELQRPSAMKIFPPSQDGVQADKKVEAPSFDLMSITKIVCSNQFNYQVVTKLKTGKPNKPKLFMFHAASGLALPYTHLDELDFGDVYGFSNPYFGRQDHPGFSSIEEMAQHYIVRMKKIQPEGPYYLSGWSLGGIVSQAMASILERQGETIGLVILIDSVNHSGKPYYPNSEKAAIEKILEGNTSLERYEGVKEAIQRCYLNTSMILHHYQAKPFSGRVVLLKADEHEATLKKDVVELVQWRQNLLDDAFSGWGDLLPNLEVQSVAGGHNELFDTGYIPGVHIQLKAILTTVGSHNTQEMSLSQRWSMNLVKALRREDSRIVKLLLQKPEYDYSYQDSLGNLLDAIVVSENLELLERLDARILMSLQTSIGSKASDIALENGLLELFGVLEASSYSFFEGRNDFFAQSSQSQSFQGKVLSLL